LRSQREIPLARCRGEGGGGESRGAALAAGLTDS